MLIPFPIAFFVSAFLTDIAYWRTTNAEWLWHRNGSSGLGLSWRHWLPSRA
jgi:uncharacterized membrane protein